ncbi:hypothetical protein GGR51DRAFT_555261 [Nemania sp. FL0031]|nr:hypothetical protein GGR51DRAFT_555261 [Nemania sp. FL0031]
MSYYIHPDVETLKFIADNWTRDQKVNSSNSTSTSAPHDAQALARLVSNASWAVQDPYSEGISRFVKWYRKAQEWNVRGMSDAKLEDELQKFEIDIDEIFFFSLLTRKTPGLDRLVRVKVIDELVKGRNIPGAYKPDPKSPTIIISRYSNTGNSRRVEQLIHSLVHEMCHAFLGIFSDTRNRKHQAWVADFDRHGEMFWVLHRFIMGKIAMYTKSERWKKELNDMEIECYDMTKRRGEPGSWGTPERILMGGVLPP